jgi:tetratricopeptide (TPR) repeat protein
MARSALQRSGPADEPAIAAIAHQALGVAAREDHHLDLAAAELRIAIELAGAGGLTTVEGMARVNLASVLFSEGQADASLAELDRAIPLLGDTDEARALMQRATVLERSGRSAEALADFDRALDRARAGSDALTEALVLGNRGLAHCYADRPGAGERDLEQAERLFHSLDMALNAADTRHNRGFAAAAAGDLALALQHYQHARRDYERLRVERPNALLDEARALLETNLVAEAHEAAAAAVQGLLAAGQGADLAEALLVLAEASDAAGAPNLSAAEEARTLFAEQGRPAWSTLAAFVALRLRADVTPAELRPLAAALAVAGWLDASLEARLLAAEAALRQGDRDGAFDDLAAVAEHRRRGPAARRLRGWYALAVSRRASGDRAGASRAASSGVRVASLHAVSLSATELRARAGVVVEPLVDLGIGLALEARRPRRVLVWAERWRAGGLASTPVSPSADADLTELRSVTRRLDDEALPNYRRAELDRRRRLLEAEVDRRTRATGNSGADHAADLDVGELIDALGDRTLVEFVVHGGEVHPVSVDRRGVRLHGAVPLTSVAREVRSLRMAASRLARPRPAPSMRDAAAAAAAQLDHLLLGQIDGADELVLVPTGVLHAVPWPLLPSVAKRATTVAPSARLWLRAGARPRTRRALVVTHGVPGGSGEAAAVAACYPNARVLDGATATTAAVLDALDGVDVAHLAVHATFRADNPLYSSLQLADGPLLVHDLDRLRRTPPVVVLSACGAGQSSVDAGDELLGLTASFLRSGTTSLIASTLPVADELAPPLMAAFHRALRTDRPAVALQRAGADAPAHAGAAFTCFGRG